jgi:hypothetical protein
MVALSGASASGSQAHGSYGSGKGVAFEQLAQELARLMSPPSRRQQLKLLQALEPGGT